MTDISGVIRMRDGESVIKEGRGPGRAADFYLLRNGERIKGVEIIHTDSRERVFIPDTLGLHALDYLAAREHSQPDPR
jgi:hypothetical protein